MSTGPANLIKAQILVNLNALVTSGVLGAVIESDIDTNIFKKDFPRYPCAVLGNSDMASNWEYPQSNKRTYNFGVLIVQLQDNLKSAGDMEDLRDAIAIQFDNNVTLNGFAQLGVAAVISPKVPVAQNGKNYITFYVTLKATTLVPLTYTF